MGKRAIELAAQQAGVALQLEWQPFQLDPHIPPAGIDKIQHYTRKFGPRGVGFINDPNHHLAVRGREIGLAFQYVPGSKVFNSFNGHRLMHRAQKISLKLQSDLQEVFFRKYFSEGKDLGNVEELADAAQEVGMPKQQTLAYLSSQEDVEPVREKLEEVHGSGISGVPHFFFPNGEEVSGGQGVEEFAVLLSRCCPPPK